MDKSQREENFDSILCQYLHRLAMLKFFKLYAGNIKMSSVSKTLLVPVAARCVLGLRPLAC